MPFGTGGEFVGGGSSGGGGGTVTLTSHAGHLTSDFNFTGSLTTFLTTATLATGTWLISFGGVIGAGTGQSGDYEVSLGTATATLDGKLSGSFAPEGGTEYDDASMVFIATVTVAGTLIFQAQASSGAPTFRHLSQFESFANATGYTALKVA